MNRYYYDLHIHSCLSPCGDNDMTPGNIAGMAALKGLQIVALTDHNSTKNCPAFFEACKRQGIIPIAGAEITTAEDVHIVSLFPTLEAAMAFDEALQEKRMKIKNRVDIFGDQLILDGEDNVIGTDEYLLPNATMMSIDEAYAFARQFGAAVYPAHIDRPANGIVEVLGTLPETPVFSYVEFKDKAAIPGLKEKIPSLDGKGIIESSDAHYLWDINEADAFFMLEDEPYSGDFVRAKLFEKLLDPGKF